MSIIGNPLISSAFVTDQFSGNGSTTAFTMSVAPATTASMLVSISGVLQNPSAYSISGTTLTFSSAPPSGTGNISVRYLGIPASGVVTTAYRTITEFTATAAQTTFSTPSYTVGYINVYQNGVRLGAADFTATNGTSVVLTTGATAGDLVTTESFYVSSVLNAIPNTAGSVGSNNLVSGITLTSPAVAGTPTGVGVLTSGTVQTPTTSTILEYTAIPSWAKRITIQVSGLSTNGTTIPIIQLGTGATTYTTSGYSGYGVVVGNAGTPLFSSANSVGFFIGGDSAATYLRHGTFVLTNITGNTWVLSGQTMNSEVAKMEWANGSIALAATLTAVRVTTALGVEQFDAGSINIMYE